MSLRKRLRILTNNLKDKASVIAASFSLKRHASSVRVHVILATTHSLPAPPSEARIAAVLSAGRHRSHSHVLPRACIHALMERLHRTRSATVALKCLFTLHNVMAKGPLALKDTLSYYPSNGGRNFLNLSEFRDDTDHETSELSAWVRWYACVLEQVVTVSRVLGCYLSNINYKETRGREYLGVSSAELFCKVEGLVVFVEQVSRVPESLLHLQRIDLVFEVVRLVREDYGVVQREILWRVEELGKRVEGDLDVGELKVLVGCLKRLEECKERLVLLFVNRKRNNGFWDLVEGTKKKGVAVKEEIEGKWVTVVATGKERRRGESTRFTNPFLDSGLLVPVPQGGAWPRVNTNRFSLTVPTVG